MLIFVYQIRYLHRSFTRTIQFIENMCLDITRSGIATTCVTITWLFWDSIKGYIQKSLFTELGIPQWNDSILSD